MGAQNLLQSSLKVIQNAKCGSVALVSVQCYDTLCASSNSQIVAVALAVSVALNVASVKLDLEDTAPTPSNCTELGLAEQKQRYDSFEAFYPFYLCEHTKPATKLFHFVGTTLWMLEFGAFATSANPKVILYTC
jgi:hypothetical protein